MEMPGLLGNESSSSIGPLLKHIGAWSYLISILNGLIIEPFLLAPQALTLNWFLVIIGLEISQVVRVIVAGGRVLIRPQ